MAFRAPVVIVRSNTRIRMKTIQILFISLLAQSLALADESLPSVEEITQKILEVSSKYAETVSCGGAEPIPITANDIAALSPWKDVDMPDDAEYLVFWNADMGCSGGTATFGINIASVKISQLGKFYVDASESSPNKFVSGSSLLSYQKVIGASKNSVTIRAVCGSPSNISEAPEICSKEDGFVVKLQKQTEVQKRCSQNEIWVPSGKAIKPLGF